MVRFNLTFKQIGSRVVIEFGRLHRRFACDYRTAFTIAESLTRLAQSALQVGEDGGAQKGALKAAFGNREDQIVVDWGVWLQTIDVDALTALKFAEQFVRCGRIAERVTTGHERFTKREVETIEESIVSPNHRLLDAAPRPPRGPRVISPEEKAARDGRRAPSERTPRVQPSISIPSKEGFGSASLTSRSGHGRTD